MFNYFNKDFVNIMKSKIIKYFNLMTHNEFFFIKVLIDLKNWQNIEFWIKFLITLMKISLIQRKVIILNIWSLYNNF